jgi:hypothetical protein
MLYIHGRQGLKVLYLPHALPVEVWWYLCEDFSNMQLNQPIQLLSTLRFCGFPCNGLAPSSRISLSLRCTSDTYSLHTPHIVLKKGCTEADKARIQSSIAYWMNENQVTKDFLLIQCLPFFINLIEFEKRYKPKGEIITVVKPYDLRYLMLGTSNNCVPPNLRQNPSKLQDSEGFFFRF